MVQFHIVTFLGKGDLMIQHTLGITPAMFYFTILSACAIITIYPPQVLELVWYLQTNWGDQWVIHLIGMVLNGTWESMRYKVSSSSWEGDYTHQWPITLVSTHYTPTCWWHELVLNSLRPTDPTTTKAQTSTESKHSKQQKPKCTSLTARLH